MKKQLSTINRGQTFEAAGIPFIVLRHYPERSEAKAPEGYTFVEAIKDIFDAPFDEGGNNDWRSSSLRAKLNGPWLEEIIKDNPELAGAITAFHRDLTADDGLKDYEGCFDSVSLLTADEYREHRDLHPAPEHWRWLITPDGTPASSGTSFVRLVTTDGSLTYHSAFYGLYGVRPALYLKSDLLVSVEGEDEEELTPEQQEMALYEKAVEKFGEEAQILIAIEEMSELTKALLKYLRYKQFGQLDKETTIKAIAEERADVEIMLNQLHVIFGDNTEEEIAKLKHLKALVEG